MVETHRDTAAKTAPPPEEQHAGALDDAFPVDVNESEYLRFNQHLAATVGALRSRRQYLAFLLGMQAMTVAIGLYQWRTYGTMARGTILLLLFLCVLAVNILVAAPLYMTEMAKRSFEQERLCGIETAGWIRVFADRVVKTTRTAVIVLPLTPPTIFIETPDLLILYAEDGRAIVLPARCVTHEDAGRVRCAVAAALPGKQRHFFGTFVSGTPTRVELGPAQAQPPEELFCFRIRYSKGEFVRLMKNSGLMKFIQRLPLYGTTALLVALVLALLFSWVAAIFVFCAIITGCFTADALLVEHRVLRLYEQSEDARRIIRAAVTVQGLVVGTPDGSMENRIPWKAVSRLVEHRDCVDFCGKTILLRIPKRYIQNLRDLQQLVEQFTIVEDDFPG